MNTKNVTNNVFGVMMVFSLSAAVCAYAGHPKSVVTVYSQRDAGFSETITLYADGKYQQSETREQVSAPPHVSVHDLFFTGPALPAFLREPKRAGAWRVLSKAGGSPISLRAETGLPPMGVVELKGAMPFGMTWDNQLPYSLHGDRTLPTGSFQAMPPKAQAR